MATVIPGSIQSNRDRAELVALRRLGTVEDCARVVEFLATDLSDYVTGAVIPIDGGLVRGNRSGKGLCPIRDFSPRTPETWGETYAGMRHRSRSLTGHIRDTHRRRWSYLIEIIGVPYRIRTGVAAVRGRCPRPLDEGDR